ncbi:uncharacterized protein PGTG_05452 [Puccinia graminis f. sp. tritici CRL 75-36-700-3]|uniref:Uncharacterized protein n=1 Tax=Puccinia graminis f. sp. tritici (strain CRL 75-36-700-3 / race SCCL) TaxID=418459 RepID=E3K4E5_PUCGT|nr:uncharacterized protein PGTG_05452 [Puccinia graminis f. sp. tritici CRL 75-36-700-3]EFP79131.2 hypothetical protein PGTG_05452 [Puccinia graminis f. sp. tritici CRL 75-36-700-3]
MYYRCPHLPECQGKIHSKLKKSCHECRGLNSHAVRQHTSSKNLHPFCNSQCPVYDMDIISLVSFKFEPLKQSLPLDRQVSITTDPTIEIPASPASHMKLSSGTTSKKVIRVGPSKSQPVRRSMRHTQKLQSSSISVNRLPPKVGKKNTAKNPIRKEPGLKTKGEPNDGTKMVKTVSKETTLGYWVLTCTPELVTRFVV